ncbi:MAG: replication protein [Candidatus Competibacter sp.]|nr:replication protein [Candidatus Competibacter sp.]
MLPQGEPLPRLTGPGEAALYHRASDHGFFTLLWAEASDSPEGRPALKIQRAYRLSAMAQVIAALDQNRDTWISQAEFCRPDRRIVHLVRLGLCFVDLDTYKTPWRETPPESLLERFLGYCGDESIPAPSLVIHSGRGLQTKWLLERPLPRAALPRWNAVQKELVARLEPFGADPGARDASRVLRLVDTVNTRSGQPVRVMWVQMEHQAIRRYPFEFLAESLLPVSRDALNATPPTPAERRLGLHVLPGSKQGNLRVFSGRQLAWDRLEDLRRLARRRGWTERGIPHGYRSKYLHWCLNFLLLSGAVPANRLYPEAQALAREVCPDFDKDVRSVLSTLYRKAKAYEAGGRIEFNGKTYPPLYTPRNRTLLALFDVQDDEMKALKTIITPEEAAERHRERNRETSRNRTGYREAAKLRRAFAQDLRAKGLPWAEVGKVLGISGDAARKLAAR